MWFSLRTPLLLLCSLAAVSRLAAAEQMLTSSSLNTCQDNSGFTASLFDVVYTPGNATASVDIVAVSSIQGNVVFDISITAYGYQIISQTVNPCDIGLAGLCPMYALCPLGWYYYSLSNNDMTDLSTGPLERFL